MIDDEARAGAEALGAELPRPVAGGDQQVRVGAGRHHLALHPPAAGDGCAVTAQQVSGRVQQLPRLLVGDRAQAPLVGRRPAAAEEAGRPCGGELLDVARRDVQKGHLGLLGHELRGMPDAGLPRSLGDPDDGAHHTTCRANHKQTVHATRAGPTVSAPSRTNSAMSTVSS